MNSIHFLGKVRIVEIKNYKKHMIKIIKAILPRQTINFGKKLIGLALFHSRNTFVEAADEAIIEARSKLGDKVRYVNSTSETVKLPKKYVNIVLTHVLEHLDDPVLVLRRINNEWLADGGRFFLYAPMRMRHLGKLR